MNDKTDRREVDRRDQSDLIVTLDRNSAAQVKAAEDFTKALLDVHHEIEGVHECTKVLNAYFVNGFKQDIIDANNARLDEIEEAQEKHLSKLEGRMTAIMILFGGSFVSLLGMLATVLLK